MLFLSFFAFYSRDHLEFYNIFCNECIHVYDWKRDFLKEVLFQAFKCKFLDIIRSQSFEGCGALISAGEEKLLRNERI